MPTTDKTSTPTTNRGSASPKQGTRTRPQTSKSGTPSTPAKVSRAAAGDKPNSSKTAGTGAGRVERARQALHGKGKLIAAAVGVAAAAAAGLVAFKTVRGKERTVYHLMPHEDGWQVTRQDEGKPRLVRERKQEASSEARDLARDNEPSQLVIHRADGTVQTVHTYGE